MTFNPHTATQQELRDWLAGEDGWVKVKDVYGGDAWRKRSLLHDPHSNWSHPHPPTRDGAAAALPEGYLWLRMWHRDRGPFWVVAPEYGDRGQAVPDTGDEITDRYRLACLARVAMKEDSK